MPKKLNLYQKFMSGSDLWCLFFEPQRDLFKKINWQTHFLIKKLNDNEPLEKALLLDTHKCFPNRLLLCLPLSLKNNLYDFWLNLNKMSLRIFIPLGCESSDFLKPWWSMDKNHGISYFEE